MFAPKEKMRVKHMEEIAFNIAMNDAFVVKIRESF
jgi:hypothetical protein